MNERDERIGQAAKAMREMLARPVRLESDPGINKILRDFNLIGNAKHDEEALRNHFTNVWTANINTMKYSGYNLVEEVNALSPKNVLDVGCGNNHFRNAIPNLLGIDKFNPNADRVVDFLEFECEDESYDVVLALGSINFGPYSVIRSSVMKVHRILTPNGLAIFRVNPGIPHPQDPHIEYFPWDIGWIEHFARLLEFEIQGPVQVEDNCRLVFRYKKRPKEATCPTSTFSAIGTKTLS